MITKGLSSEKRFGDTITENGETSININTIYLDRPAEIYGSFFRSLRILRAGTGSLIFTLSGGFPFGIIIFFAYPEFYNTGDFVPTGRGLGITFVFFLIWVIFVIHFFFYLLRSIAWGSPRVTKFVMVAVWFLLMCSVVLFVHLRE